MEVAKRHYTQTITDLHKWISRNRYIVWRDNINQRSQAIATLANMIDDYDWQTRTYSLEQWDNAIDAYCHAVSKAGAN